MVLLQVSGCDRNIVEKAKAQSRIVLGMVTRGSNQGKAVICAARCDSVRKCEDCAGGKAGDIKRDITNGNVGCVEVRQPLLTTGAGALDQSAMVY